MEALTTETGRLFLAQGVLGALVLVLGGAVAFLYRELRKSDQTRYEELGKIIEARETVSKALTANTVALEANNAAMRERTRATDELTREIEKLRHDVEAAVQTGGFNDERVRGILADLLRRLEETQKRLEALPGQLAGLLRGGGG